MLKQARGYWFLLRNFGLRPTLQYRRARRDGWMVNYGRIFSPEELAKLREFLDPPPWEQPKEEEGMGTEKE